MPATFPPVSIAFCITDLDRGGAEGALVQLVTRLDRNHWRPAVFCLSSRGELADELEAAGVPVTCFGARGLWNLFVVFRLARDLRKLRPAILQTFLYHANIVGRIAGRLARIPRIVSGIRVAERRGRLRLWVDRWTQWLVDKHVCVSRDVARFSEEYGRLKPGKIVTIPNGVDYEKFANAVAADLSEFEIPTDARTLIAVGRLDPQKAPLTLLKAFANLATRHPDVHLLFVGDGPLRKSLQSRIPQLALQDRVHFAGHRSDVPALMRSAECLVLASVWEGMPNVVLEAMAAGLPVVASDVEGVSDLVRNGETGFLVTAGDSETLQQGLEAVLGDPAGAKRIGQSSQLFVKKGFTVCFVVESYCELYQQLTDPLMSAASDSEEK